MAVTTTPLRPTDESFDDAAQAHIDGMATPEQVALLESDEKAWVGALYRLLDRADRALETARREMRGPGRANVLHDLDEECFRIDDAITALIGPPTEDELAPLPNEQRRTPAPPREPGTTRLQLSWKGGHLVAWAGGPNAELASTDQLMARLEAADGGAVSWTPGDTVKVPGEGRADTVTAPLSGALGWLAAQARDHHDDQLGASVRWMGLLAATAVEHVAQGRYVVRVGPARSRQKTSSGPQPFRVRWIPALVDSDAISALAACVPGAAMVGQSEQDPEAFTAALLADLVHTIVSNAAAMVDAPAAPPDIRGKKDVGESIIANLDGAEFLSPRGPASEVSAKLKDWSAPITGKQKLHLIVQVDPPDDTNGWYARVLAPVPDGSGVEPLETAETAHSKTRGRLVREQAKRLERLFPALFRGGGRRRGEVILSQDEAWRLMSDDGHKLAQAGFEMRVPKLAPTSAIATLRLTSLDTTEAAVGAQQLANVRWSVMFDDVELTADDIARLAEEAKPMVQSHGQWIEIDKVDLDAAAEALAEREHKTEMTGAEMLREALGLEGGVLGGISLTGDSWAAALFQGIEDLPEHPDTRPEGFSGTLRSYQADALAWLNFLDDAGLGGCLALDMGLGKTPTTLAAFGASRDHGPGLVVAPPAVVGNWAAEAARFMPDLKVHVHHGPSRASGRELTATVAANDVVITTYGTAVRDMDQLCEIEWGRIAIDEAQAIKNPAAETSQQLRRLDGRTRIALTGTPIENGLGDLWSIMDWANPGLVGPRASFIAQLTPDTNGNGSGAGSKARAAGEAAMRALNGVLVYRRTKAEPEIAAELPDRIDELDHCMMTEEQIGLYQAVIDKLVAETGDTEQGSPERKGAVLAAITALKQICNHPWNFEADDRPLDERSGKLNRLIEILDSVFAADEKVLVFTHFATWGERLAQHLTEVTGQEIECYHGGLARGARDRMVSRFQNEPGAGALVLSLKAGGTGLNLTAANHVVLYDRWWNPAVEDQARDRAWRIGQTKTVIAHRLVCPGTVDERVEEVVAGKRQIANMVLPKSSSVGDLDADQLQQALGIDPAQLLTRDESEVYA